MPKVKRKGAYEYERDWSQNQSALVVPKVAEQVLLHDVNIRETVEQHEDIMDFMLRTKVPRSSYLEWVRPEHNAVRLQNITRYYVSNTGGSLVKVMPPLAKKPDEWRRIGIESGWLVTPCNNMKDYVGDINYDYYAQEVEKLVLGLQ